MIAWWWWWACATSSAPAPPDPCGGCGVTEVCVASGDGPPTCLRPTGCEPWLDEGACSPDPTSARWCLETVCGGSDSGGSGAVGPHEVRCTEDEVGVHRVVSCRP